MSQNNLFVPYYLTVLVKYTLKQLFTEVEVASGG